MLSFVIDNNQLIIKGLNNYSDADVMNCLTSIVQTSLLALSTREARSREEALLNYGYYCKGLNEQIEKSLYYADEIIQ